MRRLLHCKKGYNKEIMRLVSYTVKCVNGEFATWTKFVKRITNLAN